MRIAFPTLRDLVVDILVAVDVLPEHAETTANRLIEADLRGRSGHGVIRIPYYVTRIEAGGINLRPDVRITRSTPVSGLVDGDNGLGQVVMTVAAETAIAKADTTGMAWVGTVRSNHAGAAGVYTEIAASRGLIAIYMAVASANVMPPWGGEDRLLGTNPISIAIPGEGASDFHLDIATTVASHGKIKVLAQRGEEMPEGWVMGLDGQPITDPNRADEGFLVPIGGYKGAGLNMAIGLLAGTLNGAAFGSEVIDHRAIPDQMANTGQAIFLMRPDLFREVDDFRSAVGAALTEMRDSGPTGAVHIPGDAAKRSYDEQMRQGVELADQVADDLRSLGRRLGVDQSLS